MTTRKILAAALFVVVGAVPRPVIAEVQRIVIAPAVSETAIAVKASIRASREAKAIGAEEIYYFYGGRGFEPLWIREDAGTWQVSPKAATLRQAFATADELGLDPADYGLPDPTIRTTADAVAYELSVTSTALRFGAENYGGRVEPRSLSSNLDMPRPQVPMDALMTILDADDPGQALTALAPRETEFQSLLKMLKEFEAPAPVVQIGEGASIKPGTSDDRVPALRERLGQPAVQDAPAMYDEALVEAVRAFQLNAGLTSDGIVGNATREALNTAGQVTREQILVNLEKWRWLPRNRGNYRVEVNIPEYRLWVLRNGEAVHETKVVVGSAEHQTPVFYDQIRHVVVNPYWNVPTSIVRRTIAPQVLRNRDFITRGGYELFYNGEAITPSSVDWASLAPGSFPFAVRQKPSLTNSLGQVKFLFPNKHDVYLHDTPEKGLFARDARAYSSGCVRVENPFDFAAVMLANEPDIDRETLEASFGPRERWFNMEVKVPVYLTYFTLRVDAEGSVRSLADIYGHDKRIAEALLGSDL